MIRAENALKINKFHEERNKLSLGRQEASSRWKEHFKNCCPACWGRSLAPLQLSPPAHSLWDKGPSQGTPGAGMRTSHLILHDTSISILIWKILMKWILQEQIFITETPCQNKLAWRRGRKTLDWIIQDNLIINLLAKSFLMHLVGIRDTQYCSFCWWKSWIISLVWVFYLNAFHAIPMSFGYFAS